MKQTVFIITVFLCLLTLLWGCRQTTTVILPPDSTDSTKAGTSATVPQTEAPTDSEPTVPSSAVSTELPDTEPPAVSDPEPTTEPITEPPYEPTEPPATQSATTPPTGPTTEPVTEPEPAKHPVYDISGHSVGSLEYALVDTINGKRAENELAPLTLDSTLSALARIRAYECTESFTHSRPDGRSAYSVLTDYSYAFCSDFSQQIHYGSAGISAGTVVKGWMYNAGFSGDILSPDYTNIGIGVYHEDGLTYIVCFFTA